MVVHSNPGNCIQKLLMAYSMALIVLMGIGFNPVLSYAKPFKLLEVSGQASVPTPGFFSVGVGPALTFLDLVRIDASIDLLKPLARPLGFRPFTWGVGGQVHIPGLDFTPFVGLGFAKYTYRIAPGSVLDPKPKKTKKYLTPNAGIEIRKPGFYFGIGVTMLLVYNEGTKDWKLDKGSLVGNEDTSMPVSPFGYIGIPFF